MKKAPRAAIAAILSILALGPLERVCANSGLILSTGAPVGNYTIAVSASPSADGTVSGGGTFASGSSQTVVATPNSGFSFVNWTESSSVVSSSASYTFVLSANRTLVANFVPTVATIIPADRLYAWNPGMMSKGGIPTRNTICGTLSPSGGDDTSAIQALLDTCPAGQVVYLNPGTFIINNYLLLHSSITLRGSGKGSTILFKTNGAHGRLPTIITGTNGIHDPEPTYATGLFTGSISGVNMTISAVSSGVLNVGDVLSGPGVAPGTLVVAATSGSDGVGTYRVSPSQTVPPGTAIASAYPIDTLPVLIIGPSRYPGPDPSTTKALTADGQKDASSVTVTDGTGFAAGQIVLLDELSGASWHAVPVGFDCWDSWDGTNSGCSVLPNPPMVWSGDRVAWAMHWPEQRYQDDHGLSNSQCPYDPPFVDCVTSRPAAMSWFSRPDRPTNEMKEVASVSGNTVTFTSPLTISYRTSHTAQLTRYTLSGSQSGGNSIHVKNAGVENLSMYGGADGELRFEAAAYSWAKGIEITQWLNEGIALDSSFRIEIRDSYLHTGSWPMPGGAGYIISFANAAAEVLVENNIMLDTCKDIVMRSAGAGSVIAYNYADDPFDYNSPIWQEVALNASHMSGPHHVLFEGNYSENFDSDYTHGNAIYLTIFRNVLTGQRRSFTDTQNVRAAGLAYGSWWDSYVGNIFGRSGQMAGWSYAVTAMSCDANGDNCTGNNSTYNEQTIWRIGYDPERWGMHPDPQTLATMIRDGNYDFVTNSQRWHNTPAHFAMPNSLYLNAKPAFFGSNPWPWTDPATGTVNVLPAKARYDAGTP